MKVCVHKKHWKGYLCAALMLALLVLHFVPYWFIEGNKPEEVSISQLVWFPDKLMSVKTFLDIKKVEFTLMNEVVLWGVLSLLLSAGGLALNVMFPDLIWTQLASAIYGVAVAVCAFMLPALRLGQWWWAYVLLGAAVAAISVLGMLQHKK